MCIRDSRKIGTREGADTMLGDDNLAFFWGDESGNRSQRFLKQFLMLRRGLNGTQEDVSRTNFWKSGAEADLDMDNGKAGGTSCGWPMCSSPRTENMQSGLPQ